jgi:hypothetical protein
MKNVVSAMFVASVLGFVGVAAQDQPATPRQQPATQSEQPAAQGEQPAAPTRQQPAPASRQAPEKVTISGCIQNAAAGGAGDAASAATAPKFVLAKGKMVSGAAGSAVGTSGTTPTVTEYRLDGEDKTISPHLNHQVEITGTIQRSSASATGAANAAPGSAAAGPMLKVDSVKMIAATCPQ